MAMKIRIKKEQFEKIIDSRLMTQKEIAQRAGLSNVYISHMKHPKKHGSKTVANKILKVLKGVTFDEIFFVVH